MTLDEAFSGMACRSTADTDTDRGELAAPGTACTRGPTVAMVCPHDGAAMLMDRTAAGSTADTTVHALRDAGKPFEAMNHAVPMSGDHIGTEGQAQAFVLRRSG
ncbi:hypothetical protein ABT330_19060 [Streptomyces sp. NPDC000658]|uniref:hypothetical protein n=1 Tax=Streptomyces sp. NPDC000658 TaxID=3154266 RepID=UPI00331A3673